MAKRYTDTEKWKKDFVRTLEAPYKLLWFYILDDCDHAGIWHVEFDVAQLRVGCDIDKNKALEFFKKKVVVFDDGLKWFIPAFLSFQYGTLNIDNKVHKSVIDKLKKGGLYKGLGSILEDAMDKEEDKDKVKDKAMDKEKEIQFDKIYSQYPKKSGRKEAWKYFKASVTNDIDYGSICKALDNYIKHLEVEKTEPKYIKMASTWFNNWKDWIDWKEPEGYGKSIENVVDDLGYKHVKNIKM